MKVGIGETSSVNLDGVLTPLEATLDLWRGAAVGGALTILVELHGGSSTEELLLGSHGVASIPSSWSWDAQRGIGTLSLRGDSTATSLNFRAMLDVLQLRSAVGASDSYRRILVRPDISGSAFKKDFHVREVKVSGNEAPEKPAAALPEQTVDEDATVTYQVPEFTDKEDDAASKDLGYEAKLVVSGSEGDLLTDAWITFDKNTRTFTFKPLPTHVGRHTLRVRGTDSGGLSDYVDFDVVVSAVNDAPEASSVSKHVVDEDVASDHATATYVVPAFTDEDDDTASASFKYEAKLVVNGTPEVLPSWITFVKATRTFTFKPLGTHVGSHTLRVTGTDAGDLSDSVDFVLEVREVNDAPEASAVPEKEVDEDATVTYRVPAFTDEDDDTTSAPFTYVAQLVLSGTPGALPSWIKFDDKSHDNLGNLNPTFRTFTFTPEAAHVGDYTLRVTGTDSGKKSDFVDFKVTVKEVNDPPKPPTAGLDNQEVDEDATVTYRVPAFTDEETSVLTYTFEVVRDGSATAVDVSDWVEFDDDPTDDQGNVNPNFRTFTFKPLAAHVGKYKVTVKGEDAGIPGKLKKSVSAEFELEVAEVNDKPEASIVPEQKVDEDVDPGATYVVPAFTDEDDDTTIASFKYVAQLVVSGTPGDLPAWIKFDDNPTDDNPADPKITTFRTFTFTPEAAHVGDYTLRVTGTDAGGKSAFVEFDVVVSAVNDAPKPPTAALDKSGGR